MSDSVGGRAFAIRAAVLSLAALAFGACGRLPSDVSTADLSSELEATTVVDGLTIVMQSFQTSRGTGRYFNVTFQ